MGKKKYLCYNSNTMVNTGDFVARLEKVLKYYGLSASAFADKIKVQRSSISHLLTGRNNPSLDFVLKVIRAYPEVNLYWLLMGQGTFPAEPEPIAPSPLPKAIKNTVALTSNTEGQKSIQKIVIFYTDNSFDSFEPN